MDTQIRIMRQSNAMQEAIQDLHRWENEMKQKEKFTHQTVAANEVSFVVRSANGIVFYEFSGLTLSLSLSFLLPFTVI